MTGGCGSLNATGTITVTEPANKLIVTAFPNPYANDFSLKINPPVSGMATIMFYSAFGNKLYEMNQYMGANVNNLVNVNNTGLFTATVFCRIVIGNYESTQLIIKQ